MVKVEMERYNPTTKERMAYVARTFPDKAAFYKFYEEEKTNWDTIKVTFDDTKTETSTTHLH